MCPDTDINVASDTPASAISVIAWCRRSWKRSPRSGAAARLHALIAAWKPELETRASIAASRPNCRAVSLSTWFL